MISHDVIQSVQYGIDSVTTPCILLCSNSRYHYLTLAISERDQAIFTRVVHRRRGRKRVRGESEMDATAATGNESSEVASHSTNNPNEDDKDDDAIIISSARRHQQFDTDPDDDESVIADAGMDFDFDSETETENADAENDEEEEDDADEEEEEDAPVTIHQIMKLLPVKMDDEDKYNLRCLLYETGMIPAYLKDVSEAARDGLSVRAHDDDDDAEEEEEEGGGGSEPYVDQDAVDFADYFDFKDDICIDNDSDTYDCDSSSIVDQQNRNRNGKGSDSGSGKITFLRLERRWDMDEDANFPEEGGAEEERVLLVLPSSIERFQRLEMLRLWGCDQIPAKLYLPSLKRIEFCCCSESMFRLVAEHNKEEASTQLQLPRLEKVMFHGQRRPAAPTTFGPYLRSFLTILPDTLPELEFQAMTDRETNEILSVLCPSSSSLPPLGFVNHLKILRLTFSELTNDDFHQLVFQISPMYPNLRTIDLSSNNITSIQRSVPPSIQNQQSASTSVLSTLNLDRNPVLQNVHTDSKEHEAFLSLLTTVFPTISSLGIKLGINKTQTASNSLNDLRYDSDIKFRLLMNQTGRHYINNSRRSCTTTATATTTVTTTTATATSRLHRGLWPLIFERCYRKSSDIYEIYNYMREDTIQESKCSTGIYYLLLNYWNDIATDTDTTIGTMDSNNNININNDINSIHSSSSSTVDIPKQPNNANSDAIQTVSLPNTPIVTRTRTMKTSSKMTNRNFTGVLPIIKEVVDEPRQLEKLEVSFVPTPIVAKKKTSSTMTITPTMTTYNNYSSSYDTTTTRSKFSSSNNADDGNADDDDDMLDCKKRKWDTLLGKETRRSGKNRK